MDTIVCLVLFGLFAFFLYTLINLCYRYFNTDREILTPFYIEHADNYNLPS